MLFITQDIRYFVGISEYPLKSSPEIYAWYLAGTSISVPEMAIEDFLLYKQNMISHKVFPPKKQSNFFLAIDVRKMYYSINKTWFPIDFPPNKNHHPSSHVFLPCQELQAAGYEVQLHTFNARNLTAQSRKRVFFFGLREGVPGFAGFRRPWVPELQLRARDVLENEEELMLG